MVEEHEPRESEERRIEELETEVEVLEEIIDLKEWARAHKEPRRAKRHRIRIDRDYKAATVHSMTGRDLGAGRQDPGVNISCPKSSTAARWSRSGPIRSWNFTATGSSALQTLARDPTEG